MSHRLHRQLKSIVQYHQVEAKGRSGTVTVHTHNTDRVGDVFPKRGKRTDAKMARLVTYARKH